MKTQVSSSEYERDNTSGGLINVDHNGLAAYKKRKFLSNKRTTQIDEMSNDINSLKEDFQEIKSILMQLVNNIDK
jgi:hypothetical protein|tara:strand:+ start:50 stop:274 length:225 start_codon:yes stop_codon:yes gene_type:complete